MKRILILNHPANSSGYALVVVLMVLLVTMILGSYFLKKSSFLDKAVQMSLNEKQIQQQAVQNFNELAQRVRSRVESAINEAVVETPLLDPQLCNTALTCVSEAMSPEEAAARGISFTVECRGEGTPLLATRCSTSRNHFPKQLLIRMQQVNPANPDEVLYATGEVRYQPVPLNAYALALTNAQDVRFGPGTYDGNIAINLSNSQGATYKVHLYPGVNDPINFNGIVTVSAGELDDDGSAVDEAVVFHTDAQRKVNYVGFRTSSQLGNLQSLFQQAADDALVDPNNEVVSGNPAGYFPDIALPTVDGTNIKSAQPLDDKKSTEIKLSAIGTGAACRTDAVFREEFKKVALITMPSSSNTLPDGYQFEAGHDAGIDMICNYISSLCLNDGACWGIPSGTKRCTVVKVETDVRHDGPLENNSILVTEDREVILDRLNPADNAASSCGVNLAVYAKNGYFKANAGFEAVSNNPAGTAGGGRQPKLKAAFISGIGINNNDPSVNHGAVVFHENTLGEHGETLGSVKNGVLPTEGPTLRFDATIVGLGNATSAVKFIDNLIQPGSGAHTLGEFHSKGGQIAARASDYRTVYTSGSSAGQVAGGFNVVKHEFVLNDSPVLSAREFAANLDATVHNFNIGFPDARDGLARLNLDWDESVPSINYVPTMPSQVQWIHFGNASFSSDGVLSSDLFGAGGGGFIVGPE